MLRALHLRRIGLALAFAGVLLRGLVPTGFMPTTGMANSPSGAWLTLCRGGELTVVESSHDRSRPAHHASVECPFASSGSTAPPPVLARLAVSFVPHSVLRASFVADCQRIARRLLPPARAPPIPRV